MVIVEEKTGGIPVGTMAYHVSAANDKIGWLLCDGATFDVNTYPDLYAYLEKDSVPSVARNFMRGEDNDVAIILEWEPSQTGKPHTAITIDTKADHNHTGVNASTFWAANDNTFRALDSGDADTKATGLAGKHEHTLTGWDAETVPDHKYLAVFIKT